MTGIKTGIILAALTATTANLPELTTTVAQVPANTIDQGLVRSVVGLGATGVLGALMWRMIDVLGKAMGRNADAIDRMREHCSARNGEAQPPKAEP
jgi:hypothetical protein